MSNHALTIRVGKPPIRPHVKFPHALTGHEPLPEHEWRYEIEPPDPVDSDGPRAYTSRATDEYHHD